MRDRHVNKYILEFHLCMVNENKMEELQNNSKFFQK